MKVLAQNQCVGNISGREKRWLPKRSREVSVNDRLKTLVPTWIRFDDASK